MKEPWRKNQNVFDDIELLSKPISELTKEDMRKVPHNAMYEVCDKCKTCDYYLHEYWNCQGEKEPCEEYYPNIELRAERKEKP